MRRVCSSIRHVGIALVPLILAPIAQNELDTTLAETRERGAAIILDASIDPRREARDRAAAQRQRRDRGPARRPRQACSRTPATRSTTTSSTPTTSLTAQRRRPARHARSTRSFSHRLPRCRGAGPARRRDCSRSGAVAAVAGRARGTSPHSGAAWCSRALGPARRRLRHRGRCVRARSDAARLELVEIAGPVRTTGTSRAPAASPGFAAGRRAGRARTRWPAASGSSREELVLALADEEAAREYEERYGVESALGARPRRDGACRASSAPRARAAFSVFTSSIARVIGPTPPGTGVIARARSSRPRSRRRRRGRRRCGSSRRRSRPRPRRTMSPSPAPATRPRPPARRPRGRPPAGRACASGSAYGGVRRQSSAPSACRPASSGRAPRRARPPARRRASSSSRMTPAGVQGTSLLAAVHQQAGVRRGESVHVLRRVDQPDELVLVEVLGQRELEQDAVDAVVRVQPRISSASSSGATSPAARGGTTRSRPRRSPRASSARRPPRPGRRPRGSSRGPACGASGLTSRLHLLANLAPRPPCRR